MSGLSNQLEQERAKALNERDEARAQLAECRAVLREVQWQPRYRTPGYDNDTCPVCKGVDAAFIGGEGHALDCRLAKALEGK